MLIKNITKNRIISTNAKLCNSTFSKFIGLMFSKKQEKSLILKFFSEEKISLHMFFVLYPIDVLFLNKSRIVVDTKEKFKPFTFYKSKKNAMYAIELPSGNIKRTNTSIGDKIRIS